MEIWTEFYENSLANRKFFIKYKIQYQIPQSEYYRY